jgi:transposase-like protein
MLDTTRETATDRAPGARLTEQQIDRIACLREHGVGVARIAREIGCSESAVEWQCLKLGIEPPRPGRLPPVPTEPLVIRRGTRFVRRFTAAEDAQILAMSAAGKTLTEIARALDRRVHSIIGRKMTLARHEARREGAQP